MEHGGLRPCRHLKPIQSSYLVVRYTLVCMLPVPFVFVFNWFLFFSLSNTIVPSVETICFLMLQPRKFTQIAEKIITEIPVFMENFKFWEVKFVCVQGLSQFIMYVVEQMIGSKLLICCWTCLSGTDKHQALCNCCMLLHEMDSSIKSTSAFRVHNDHLNQCIITEMSRVWSWLQQSAIVCWKKSKIYFVFLYFAWRSIQTTCTIFTPLETKLKPIATFLHFLLQLTCFLLLFSIGVNFLALIGWYVVYLYDLQYSAEMCIFSNFLFLLCITFNRWNYQFFKNFFLF